MIYDCFTFFNELDLLEIRLNILDKTVDKFVLVEATRTHAGKLKPLYFTDNKSRYNKFLDKIIHVVVDEYPDYDGKTAWVLERHQRDMISRGLVNCKPEDVILISDVDEIPSPQKIIEYKDKRGIKIFLQQGFYYFLNCVNRSLRNNYQWPGPVMINFTDMKTPQYYRNLSIALTGFYSSKFLLRIYAKLNFYLNIKPKWKKIIFVDNGGWHFSYLGGVEAIIRKLEAFAHQEYNKEQFKDAISIEEAITKGKDIFGRDFTYKFIPIDASFPDYIIENKSKYEHLIKT